MLREYGEAGVTPIVLIGKFWQDPNLLAQLTTGEAPSSVFAKFGVLIGLPDLKVHQWNEFMAHRTPHPAHCNGSAG